MTFVIDIRYLTRLLQHDQALEQYELIIQKFPAYSRYGTEALFFSAQINYQKQNFTEGIQGRF